MTTKEGGPTVRKRPAAGTKTGRVWDTADALTPPEAPGRHLP